MRRSSPRPIILAMNRSSARKLTLVADQRVSAAGRDALAVKRFRLARLRLDPAAPVAGSALKHP